MHEDAAFFDKSNSGDVLFNYNNCAEYACSGLLNSMKMFSTRLFSSLSLICVLFYNSWQLAIIAVIVLLGALYPLTKVRKRIKDINEQSVLTNAEVMTHYNETFGGSRVISSYNLYDYQNKHFNGTLRQAFKQGMRKVMTSV